jgi:hypothetical protein
MIHGLQSHTKEPNVGDIVVNINPNCKHKKSIGRVIELESLPDDRGKAASYVCMNSGPSWDKGDILSKTLDQLSIIFTEGLAYHLENDIPLNECVYRPGSDAFFSLIREMRDLAFIGEYSPTPLESYYLFETEIGEFGFYEGKRVPLDWPFMPDVLEEAEYKGRDVNLSKPQRSPGPKKYRVYVKNKQGKVIKVEFGDEKGGLTAKIGDPKARASFAARHNCEQKKDKTKPGYWACRLPRYAEQLGLKKVSAKWW